MVVVELMSPKCQIQQRTGGCRSWRVEKSTSSRLGPEAVVRVGQGGEAGQRVCGEEGAMIPLRWLVPERK